MNKLNNYKMKSLAETFDSFKISNPKVFLIVTLIANIVIGVLDYYGTYGSEELKPVVLTITSVVTLILSYLGVRTTRFLNTDSTVEPTTEITNDGDTN